MHRFLKSIGFSTIHKQKDIEMLIMDALENFDEKQQIETDDGRILAEFRKEYAYDCGISVVGEYDEYHEFHVEYFQPYFMGGQRSSYEEISTERFFAREAYAGACDDLTLGITLIFYMNDPLNYLKKKKQGLKEPLHHIYLSALAAEGRILLPVIKSSKQEEQQTARNNKKKALLLGARNGDQEAIDQLALDDFDTFTMLSKRVGKEDIFTIVESTFMPQGLECDQYIITGEILDIQTSVNQLSEEKLYELTLECNNIKLDVVINEKDLLGEPAVGRRFRGSIWLQGHLETIEYK